MDDIKSSTSWHIIPMREFPNLSVVRDRNGNIVATVQNEYVHLFDSLPELLAASREIFDKLTQSQKNWAPTSILGRLENAIAKIESTNRESKG